FKNKEIKKLFLVFFLVLIVFLFFGILFSKEIYKEYKQNLISNNAKIVNGIIEKHPELENEVINLITEGNSNSETLDRYGLTDLNNLDYLGNNGVLKANIIIKISFFILSFSFVLLFIIFLFVKKLYNKINNISKYTHNILNNNYSMDIREYSEGDISNLKNDLYKMTIKLKEQSENLTNDKKFLETTLSDISHQLKTPLTSLFVINDILYDNVSNSVKHEFLNQNKEQLKRIEWLIKSLLIMSRLDSGTTILAIKKTNIKEVLKVSIEPLKIISEIKNIELLINCNEKIYANIDFNWTVEALGNIIKNAIEHTNKGSVIIDASENPLYTEITVKDTGLGISKKDLPHIFERFYKGINNKESIGIGLNMAKTIIEKENGDITVTSDSNGTLFRIKFYNHII
ncbi:MAG: HAMP domain-containing sensor histidine kinase, partial [Bacilli bacterium]